MNKLPNERTLKNAKIIADIICFIKILTGFISFLFAFGEAKSILMQILIFFIAIISGFITLFLHDFETKIRKKIKTCNKIKSNFRRKGIKFYA